MRKDAEKYKQVGIGWEISKKRGQIYMGGRKREIERKRNKNKNKNKKKNKKKTKRKAI